MKEVTIINVDILMIFNKQCGYKLPKEEKVQQDNFNYFLINFKLP